MHTKIPRIIFPFRGSPPYVQSPSGSFVTGPYSGPLEPPVDARILARAPGRSYLTRLEVQVRNALPGSMGALHGRANSKVKQGTLG